MKYRIVADSSCDLNRRLKERLKIGLVPLKIEVDGLTFVDDRDISIKKLLSAMKRSLKPLKTSSPSPGDFLKEYDKGDNVFVVTISSALSSTYNNAMLARDIAMEKGDKFIHVFDSLSASVGETLISMKIFDLIENKHNREDIISKTEEYIKEMKTFFVLESLENLIKAGRMNRIMGKIATRLSIRPIMGASDEGSIKLVEKARGSKRAFKRLVAIIGEQGERIEEKILGIAHSNALDKAMDLKKEIQKKYRFKDIIVVETAGLSTAYADDGGIIIAF